MNDSLLRRHITIYSEQLRSRRLWNIFIIIIFYDDVVDGAGEILGFFLPKFGFG